jgi:8-oxo-dGTP pyrophosphatase MutT (NUDIX family)
MSLHADVTRALQVWSAPDAEQERLRQLYLDHLAAHPDGVLRECRPDHVTASALVMTADTERVLLVRHRKAGLWLQTGGHCEADDPTLAAAAAREALEETGIADLQVDPVPLRLSRHAVPFCSPGGHHLDVQLLAVAPSDASPVVAEGEDPVAWFGADDTVEPTDDDTRALIVAARSRLRGTSRP